MIKQIVKTLVVIPLKSLRKGYLFRYHKMILKVKNVKYSEMPKCNGKLIIYNNGECILGKNIIFNSSIDSNLVGLSKPCTIKINTNSKLVINDGSGFSGVSIYCSTSIHIGKFVTCGGNVSIWDTDFHPLNYMDRRQNLLEKINSSPIEIGDDVFIGANSIILKGVKIGSRSIIGAGSVVTKSIPEDQVWAGNPACFIKMANGRTNPDRS